MTSDNPPYFQVGTNVSARYKGAFCSANVKKVKRKVKVKVLLASKPRPKLRLIMDDDVFGPLHTNSKVRAIDPEKGALVDATVLQVIDRSLYTVVFNDGDISTLPRSGVCTPGKRHYNAKDSLDNFPLLDPKEFSSPVMAGTQQVPTMRANRRLARTQTSDNVAAGPSAQIQTLTLTPEVSMAEFSSSLMRSCRQKKVVASSSSGSLPGIANRPKLIQKKKKPTPKKRPALKNTRRKVLGFKKNAWRGRKTASNVTAQKVTSESPSKAGRPKKIRLTEPSILEVIDGIQKSSRENSRKLPAAGMSILRLPITEGPRAVSPESPEAVCVQALFQLTQGDKATGQAPFRKVNERDVRNVDEEEEHDSTDGSEHARGSKKVKFLDNTRVDAKPGKSGKPQDDVRPCCSKELRHPGTSASSVVYPRRNTRANAARAFPKTVDEMYKELCVIVNEKNVEIPTTPPVGKRFNFVPENLELVTDPKERERLIMSSLENLCVTYFGIKEHLSKAEEAKPPNPKKK